MNLDIARHIIEIESFQIVREIKRNSLSEYAYLSRYSPEEVFEMATRLASAANLCLTELPLECASSRKKFGDLHDCPNCNPAININRIWDWQPERGWTLRR